MRFLCIVSITSPHSDASSGLGPYKMSLEDVPPEIFHEIFIYLSSNDIGHLSLASSKFMPIAQSWLFKALTIGAKKTDTQIRTLLGCLERKEFLVKSVQRLDFAIVEDLEAPKGGLDAVRLEVLEFFSKEGCKAEIQYIRLSSWYRWGLRSDDMREPCDTQECRRNRPGAYQKSAVFLHRNETEGQRRTFSGIIRLLRRHGASLRNMWMRQVLFPARMLLLCPMLEVIELEGCRVFESIGWPLAEDQLEDA